MTLASSTGKRGSFTSSVNAELIGGGVGSLMIGRFLNEIVLCNLDVVGVWISIHADNRRLWRCLEKFGFFRGEAMLQLKC